MPLVSVGNTIGQIQRSSLMPQVIGVCLGFFFLTLPKTLYLKAVLEFDYTSLYYCLRGSEAYLGDFESYFGMKVDFCAAKSRLFA